MFLHSLHLDLSSLNVGSEFRTFQSTYTLFNKCVVARSNGLRPIDVKIAAHSASLVLLGWS